MRTPLTWDDRGAFLDARGRERVHVRMLACAEALEVAFKLPRGAIARARRLGCGYYGCAYMIAGRPRSRAVIKVTTDPLEANVAKKLVSVKKPPRGLIQISAIRSLGSCSFVGRDRRPIYAIEREELDDGWRHVRRMGVKLRDFKVALYALSRYLDDHSGRTTFRSVSIEAALLSPERADLVFMLQRIEGVALLEACEWLLRRDMYAIDVIKPENIGYRAGTGLVLRDVGATEAGFDVRAEIETIGTARRGRVSRRR